MRTSFLSSRERERGARAYLTHSLFNGMGFVLLADTTVALMAVNLGASNTQMGYIGAATHLSGLILPFISVLFAGMNIGRVYTATWFARGFVCAVYFLIPFMNATRGLAVLITAYTLFCMSRAVGVAMSGPTQRALSTRATLGRLLARASFRLNIAALLARGMSAVILRLPWLIGMRGLLMLELLGIGANSVAAYHLRRLGIRDTIERTHGLGIFGTFREHIRREGVLHTLSLHWSVLLTVIMFSFTIPFLKRSAGMSESMIFVYMTVAGLAAIVAATVVQPFVDRLGSRPLLLISNACVAATAVAWALVPPSAALWLFLALGFVTMLNTTLAGLSVSRLVVSLMPDHDKMSYTAMYSFFAAIVALIGGIAGGLLTDLGAAHGTGLLHGYSFAYFAAASLSALGALGALWLPNEGTVGLRTAAGILFSPRNLRDFIDIYHLDTTRNPARREAILATIEQSDTPLATTEIGNRLKSPVIVDRERALKSLFAHPRPELLGEVLDEARDRHSHVRTTAVFALGAYPQPEVAAVLREMLDEHDVAVQSAAAKSLARIGDVAVLDRVRADAMRTDLPSAVRVNYAIALTLMDREGEHLRHIFDLAHPSAGHRSTQWILSTYARFLELTPHLHELFHQENLERGAGFAVLLEETRELGSFLSFESQAREEYGRGNRMRIWEWCREQLEPRRNGFKGPPLHMAAAIGAWDLESTDDTNTLAAAYFTYHILRSPTGWPGQ